MNTHLHPTLAKRHCQQSGIILPMVLIFLLLLMISGVAAIRNVTLEEKIAGGARNQQIAFQAAEEGLRFCESYVRNTVVIPPKIYAGKIPIPIGTGAADPKNWEIPATWTDATFHLVAPLRAGVTTAPDCVIEVIGLYNLGEVKIDKKATDPDTFRITARGYGPLGNNAEIVQLQSYLSVY